jgi:proline dehydrogenase
MLRSLLIHLSKAAWAKNLVTKWKFAWRAASRFVAGSSIQDAIIIVKELNSKGINVTLDHLGESTTTEEEASKAAADILELLDEIDRAKVRSNVSVKLTQIGLALGGETCEKELEEILQRARKYGNFVRIDMEDSPYTDKTIQMYLKMRDKGFDNTGLVIQSYLYRSEKDIEELLCKGTRIRLVKGAYKEPAIAAYPKKADVDSSFDKLTGLLIDKAVLSGISGISQDGRIPPIPAIATHDARRIEYTKKLVAEKALPKTAVEFQMLFGIRRDLQEQCVAEGYPVRIYVPYGTHWYPYYMRRLAERPANIWFFVSNYFRK